MLIDASTQSVPDSVTADLCIMGCGPAGLAIAKAFIGSGLNVCCLEAGGLEPSWEAQDSAAGPSTGLDVQLARSRIFAFGGGGSVWGGGCMPIRSNHLSGRAWVPFSDWPLSTAELQPFEPRAAEFLRLPPVNFGVKGSTAQPRRPPLEFPGSHIENYVYICNEIDLGGAYRSILAGAPNVTVILYARARALSSRSDSVDEAQVVTSTGRQFNVRARHYIVAAGGVENARLLLSSDLPSMSRHHLGRHFMDHPIASMGQLKGARTAELCWRYEHSVDEGTAAPLAQISTTAAAEASLGIMAARVYPYFINEEVIKFRNAVARFRRHRGGLRVAGSPRAMLSVSAARALIEEPLIGPQGLWDDMRTLALNLPERLRARLSDTRPGSGGGSAQLLGFFEHAPDPSNRVLLSKDADSWGIPRASVHWRFSVTDSKSMRLGSELLGQELARTSGTMFEPSDWLRNGGVPPVRSAAHHMGTTRMATDPRDGVVDANCTVHGVSNLHVAGSSVFPSGGGWAFPTFTIVTLAFRLAERLQSAF